MLDTGCRVTHEDLKDNIVDTYDATKANKSNDLPGDVTDVTGHGTHVAGIASARADKGKGVARTSYNAGLSIVKVFPSYDVRNEATGVRKRVSSCYTDDMVIGYKHVLETRSAHNIRVVNMSLQGSRGTASAMGTSSSTTRSRPPTTPASSPSAAQGTPTATRRRTARRACRTGASRWTSTRKSWGS